MPASRSPLRLLPPERLPGGPGDRRLRAGGRLPGSRRTAPRADRQGPAIPCAPGGPPGAGMGRAARRGAARGAAASHAACATSLARGPPGPRMGLITAEMRDFVDRLRLGFVATVSPDGRPCVSPRGTIMAWGASDELVIADIRSPGTTSNVERNPEVEVCIVDPLLRRGYRLRGRAEVLRGGDVFDAAVAAYRRGGVRSGIRAVLRVRLYEASDVRSPLYDLGMTEAEIRERWKAAYAGF